MSRDESMASGDATPVLGGVRRGKLPFLVNKNLPPLPGDASLLDAHLAVLKSRNQNSLQPRAENFEELSDTDKKFLVADLQEVFGIMPLDKLEP